MCLEHSYSLDSCIIILSNAWRERDNERRVETVDSNAGVTCCGSETLIDHGSRHHTHTHTSDEACRSTTFCQMTKIDADDQKNRMQQSQETLQLLMRVDIIDVALQQLLYTIASFLVTLSSFSSLLSPISSSITHSLFSLCWKLACFTNKPLPQ